MEISKDSKSGIQFSSVQLLSHVRLFATTWIAVRQASLSITNSRSSHKLMSIMSVMPSSHLILCCPLLLLPSIFPASGFFQMRQFFASGGQSIGVSASASVLPMLDFSLYKVISYLLSSFSKRGNRPQVKCTVMRSEMVEPGQLPLFSDS